MNEVSQYTFLLHDVELELNNFRSGIPLNRRSFGILMMGLCTAFFVYYSILTLIIISIYFLQVIIVKGNLFSLETYDKLDDPITITTNLDV